jgi:hypothetical protein
MGMTSVRSVTLVCFVTLLLPVFHFTSFMAGAPYAFVTLVSSDAYLPGALALAAALKDVHSLPPVPPEVHFQTVCLTTPEIVDVSTIKHLRKAFDLVVGVEVIDQDDEKGLKLLGQCLSRILIVSLERGHNLPFRVVHWSGGLLPPLNSLPTRFRGVQSD